jgi:protein-tyrosine phosphatase
LKHSSSDINIKSVLNFRDIGGIPCDENRQIKPGIIFRSANIDTISRTDVNRLHNLNIKTIIDLRALYERKKRFNPIKNIERLTFALDFEKRTREMLKPYLFRKNSEVILSDISNTIYLEILDAAQSTVKQILEFLLIPEYCPILIHCQAGKDRTGIIAALIQLALKVNRQIIIEEYLKSNDYLIPFFKKKLLIRKILTLGYFPHKTVLFAITLKQRNIESVIDRINNHYGGIESYLESAGINSKQLEKLRTILTEDRPVR